MCEKKKYDPHVIEIKKGIVLISVEEKIITFNYSVLDLSDSFMPQKERERWKERRAEK